jgi:hypothetical protein
MFCDILKPGGEPFGTLSQPTILGEKPRIIGERLLHETSYGAKRGEMVLAKQIALWKVVPLYCRMLLLAIDTVLNARW